MATIVPAILEQTKEGFLDKLSRVTKIPGVERIQIDFGDGIFVPNTMLPVTEIDPLSPAYHFEAHLMCKEPQDFLDYKIAGFKTLIIHYEAYPSGTELGQALGAIRAAGMEPGLCLNPETEVSVLKVFEDRVKHFQLMGIHPGFQGTPFLDSTFERVAKLRSLCPGAIIEVDGGINFENAPKLVEVGTDLLIAGSVLMKAVSMTEAWEQLQAEISRN